MASKLHKAILKDLQEKNPFLGREGLVYARVSSKRQESEGSGLISQQGRCIAELRNIKVPHVETFSDSYTGGGDFMKRPEMRRMLSYIDANPHRKFVVVFDDISRFARDAMFHIKLRTEFRARDVVLRCLNFNFDESEEGEFVELIFAGKAELDRKQNRRQVVQKMKARLELGYWSFSRKRGYDMVKDPLHGKVLKINKSGRILKEALESFAEGRLLRKVDVARFLHERGFWKARNPERYIDEVSKLLTDVAYCGDVEYAPWGVSRRKGRHDALISQETFALIQKRLQKESVSSRIRMDVSPEFPLRGVLLCGQCKTKLTAAKSKGRSKTYSYYYCMNKECSERSKALPKDRVERDFEVLLRRHSLKDEMGGLVQETFDRVWKEEVYTLKQQENLAEARKRELESKIRELTEMVRTTRSETVKRAYERQIEETAKELEEVGQREQNGNLAVPYRTALTKSLLLLKNPVAIWEKVDVLEKQRLFFLLFDKRLEYSKESGYRTALSLSTATLFEEFCDENSDSVDPTGLEPVTSSMPWMRSTR